MEKKELEERIDRIIAWGNADPEASHSHEDELHLELIKEYCPPEIVAEVERLNKAQFPRWCA